MFVPLGLKVLAKIILFAINYAQRKQTDFKEQWEIQLYGAIQPYLLEKCFSFLRNCCWWFENGKMENDREQLMFDLLWKINKLL